MRLERLANAAVSCVAYLGQMFVPVGRARPSYPEAGSPVWQVALAVLLLTILTAVAIFCRRSAPYLFVGWFWYLGMLVPVLELVTLGSHARADRYTYLAQIGLYLALVLGAIRLAPGLPALLGRWASAPPCCWLSWRRRVGGRSVSGSRIEPCGNTPWLAIRGMSRPIGRWPRS